MGLVVSSGCTTEATAGPPDACRDCGDGKTDGVAIDWSAVVRAGEPAPVHVSTHLPIAIDLPRDGGERFSHVSLPFSGGRPRSDYVVAPGAAACELWASRAVTLRRSGPYRIANVRVVDDEAGRNVVLDVLPKGDGLTSIWCQKKNPSSSEPAAPITWAEIRDAFAEQWGGAYAYFEPIDRESPRVLSRSPASFEEARFDCGGRYRAPTAIELELLRDWLPQRLPIPACVWSADGLPDGTVMTYSLRDDGAVSVPANVDRDLCHSLCTDGLVTGMEWGDQTQAMYELLWVQDARAGTLVSGGGRVLAAERDLLAEGFTRLLATRLGESELGDWVYDLYYGNAAGRCVRIQATMDPDRTAIFDVTMKLDSACAPE